MAGILNEFTGNEGGASNLSISLDGRIRNSTIMLTTRPRELNWKEELKNKWGVDLDNGTLASLSGKRLICKYKNNPTTILC